MNNFDLKKFLVENKLTSNSRMLKEEEEVLLNYVGSNAALKGKQVKVLSSEPDGVFVKADDGSKDFVDWSEVESLDGQKVSLDTLDQISQKAKQQRDADKAKETSTGRLSPEEMWQAVQQKKQADADAKDKESENSKKRLQNLGLSPTVTNGEVLTRYFESLMKGIKSYVGDPESHFQKTIEMYSPSSKSEVENGLDDDFIFLEPALTYIKDANTEDEAKEAIESLGNDVAEQALIYNVGSALGDILKDEGWSYVPSFDQEYGSNLVSKGGEFMTAEEVFDKHLSWLDTVVREQIYDDIENWTSEVQSTLS